MKKIKFFAPMVALFITISSLGGCSGDEGEGEETTAAESYVEVTDEDGSAVTDEEGNPVTSIIGAQPEEMELHVGFIYSGKAGDDAVSEVFETARIQAERVLNAKTYYVENVLVAQFADATAALVQSGCNVIVSTDARFANAVYQEASANGKVHFISFGGTKKLANLMCFQGEMYKTAYVCGMAAAFNSDSNILGVVADPSALSVYNVVDAYILGAKEITDEDTDVRLNWAWGSSDEETKSAIDDLVSQGCDVIFTATYSKYAVSYCESIGVKVIGISYNVPELAPTNYLTGSFYNVMTFLVDALRAVRYDTFNSQTYFGGINEGAVRLVSFGEKCKDGTDEICGALYQLCADGKAAIFSGEIKDSYGNIRVEKGAVLDDEEILEISWLEKSVTSEKNFCTPISDPVYSELEVIKSSTSVFEEVTSEETTEGPEESAE